MQRWITLSVSRARQGEFGSPRYLLFFDVRNPDSRHAAAEVRGLLLPLSDLVRRKLPVSLENIEVCPVSATPPIEGQLCLRRGEHPDIPESATCHSTNHRPVRFRLKRSTDTT